MKKLLVLFSIIILFGCENEVEDSNSTIWDEIVDKEFSNYDVWAGQGVYFFEVDGEKRCVYMKYGSGVPVVGIVYHNVDVTKDGRLILSQIELETPEGTIIQESPFSDAEILFSDDVLTLNDLEFNETDFSSYEQFLDWTKED